MSLMKNGCWLLTCNRTFWGVYESLDIQFANRYMFLKTHVTTRMPIPGDLVHNTLLQINLHLRAGYYLDESPVQPGYFAPETPRNDSMGFTGGLSLDVTSRLAIDASFAYIRFDEVDASYDHYTERMDKMSVLLEEHINLCFHSWIGSYL